MYYYAELDSNYLVIAKHALSAESDNANYFAITEAQYNEDIVGKYCNKTTGTFTYFEIGDSMGTIEWIEYHKAQNMPFSVKFDNYEMETQATLDGKADISHTHSEYASSDDLALLEDVIDTKANATHIHSEYATSTHTHNDYATVVALATLSEEVNGKAEAVHNHTEYALSSHEHNEYAEVNHNHDTSYAPISHSHSDYVTVIDFNTLEVEVNGKADEGHTHSNYSETTHNHDSDYADINHKHDSAYATVGHDHDKDYAPFSHSHTDYVTTAALNELSETVSDKANASHSHNDIYYTETEIDTKLADKANSSHNHTGVYDASGSAANALTSANAYTDSKIDALVGEGASTTLDTISEISSAIEDNQDAIDLLNSAIANKANVIDLNSHASDTEIHITETERNNWNAKSDFSGNYNDLTNKPSIPSIDGLATETYVDTQIDAIDIPSALSDLTTDSTHRVVTDSEKATWNAKSNFSGSYNDLTNKPSIPSIDGLATETYVDEAVAVKANISALTSHTGNTTVHITSAERTNWNAAKTHSDSAHAPSNAEENQNAFSNVVVGSTTISADSKTDTLTLVAGSNVTITPDTTGDSITISSANTVYTHPTTAGNKHIPAGGSSGQILRWASDGTATWGNDNNTTYSVVTQTSNGLMSNTDKAKLDGIAEGANKYTLPSAGTSLGGVKSGGDVTISSGVITVNDDSHNHVISNVDGLQSALDGKAASGHDHDDTYYTETEVDTLLSSKANTSHTHTIANITNLQFALDGKAAASHGTHVSYSTTAPVMDGTASVGTATTIARSDHKHPTDTSRAAQTSLDSHTSNKSNPHGVTLTQLGLTATATEINKLDGVTATTAELNILDGVTATTAELNYVDGVTSNIQTQLNGKAASSHTHSYAGSSSAGGAATSANKLNTDAGSATQPVYFVNGVPVKTTYTLSASVPAGAKFTDTTYGVATTSANGLMTASDKVKLDGMVFATVSEVETYLGI